jgi:two-component system, OmpR family, response regulator
MTPPSPIDVILVEDHPDLREELAFQLHSQGYLVREAADATALDAHLAERPCDVVVLDVNLPGEDGFSIARRLQAATPAPGIVMVTARDDILDRLAGLESGADIYLTKPLDWRELVASIRAVCRRLQLAQGNAAGPTGADSGWRFEAGERLLVAPDGSQLAMTAQEAGLLDLLLRRPEGEPCSREELVASMGIHGLDEVDARINKMISRLRSRLAGFDPQLRVLSWRLRGYSYAGPPLRGDGGNGGAGMA